MWKEGRRAIPKSSGEKVVAPWNDEIKKILEKRGITTEELKAQAREDVANKAQLEESERRYFSDVP
jgi:hypothetical protein